MLAAMKAFFETLHAAFHQPDTTIYRWTQGFVWLLILLSIALFAWDIAAGGLPETNLLVWVDNIILTIFAIEIALRVLTHRPPSLEVFGDTRALRLRTHVYARFVYLLSPLNLVDLLTVIAVFPALRGLRALRLLRLLRAKGLARGPIRSFLRAFEDNATLYLTAFSTLGVFVLVGGTSMWLVERLENENVQSLADGLWWALVTITTVGFGDIAPVTGLGRAIAGVLMVSGMFMLALFAGIVGHSLLNAVLSIREDQFRMSTNVNHIVICGYDEGSRMLLDTLLEEVDTDKHDVVIFDNEPRPNDLPGAFTWVHGDPTKESELYKVRMTHARAVIVVGARDRAPPEADATTILTLFTIRRWLKANLTTKRVRPLNIVAEILDAENVEHARTAGADEVIETTRMGFSLLAHAVSQPGTAQVLGEVVRTGAHSLYVGGVPPEYELPQRYGELVSGLRRQHGILVLGLRDGVGLDVLNPDDEMRVEPGYQLIYLGEREALSPST